MGVRHSITPLMMVILALAAVIASLPALEGSGRDLSYFANFSNLMGRFFPPDWSVLPDVLVAAVESARIAVLATCFAFLAALPLTLTSHSWAGSAFAVSLRAVPSLAWAVIAVAVVGPNSLAGVIALSIYSLGYLLKFMGDDVASHAFRASDVLRVHGVSGVLRFRYSVLPVLLRRFSSHGLWMLEYNLRSAAIIGYVGAGGLGSLMHVYQEYGQWNRFATVLVVILMVVVGLQILGSRLRGAPTKSVRRVPVHSSASSVRAG